MLVGAEFSNGYYYYQLLGFPCGKQVFCSIKTRRICIQNEVMSSSFIIHGGAVVNGAKIMGLGIINVALGIINVPLRVFIYTRGPLSTSTMLWILQLV